jgi:pimeloyl-ACP methyl ester carboxylesterase
MTFYYLHGFASSPQSAKAKYLRDRFRSRGLTLHCPDLNQPDFRHLTFSRQLAQVEAELPAAPITLIGSSLGGLTAAWLAERNPQVQRIVLLAPAFDFLNQWLKKLGSEALQQWASQGWRPFYHFTHQQELPLHYGFVEDQQRYRDPDLLRQVPSLILHSQQDEVIPLEASLSFAAQRPWVELIALESDHALGNAVSRIWQEIQRFCNLPVP